MKVFVRACAEARGWQRSYGAEWGTDMSAVVRGGPVGSVAPAETYQRVSSRVAPRRWYGTILYGTVYHIGMQRALGTGQPGRVPRPCSLHMWRFVLIGVPLGQAQHGTVVMAFPRVFPRRLPTGWIWYRECNLLSNVE